MGDNSAIWMFSVIRVFTTEHKHPSTARYQRKSTFPCQTVKFFFKTLLFLYFLKILLINLITLHQPSESDFTAKMAIKFINNQTSNKTIKRAAFVFISEHLNHVTVFIINLWE